MTSLAADAFRHRPPIHLLDSEADVLTDLALRIRTSQPELAQMLLSELERADVHAAGDLPAHVATMNSRVDFVDQSSGVRRSVQLVYPHLADIDAGRISVMTPMGAGLIGMAQGSTIDWPDREGQSHQLRIERVHAAQGGP